jgi:hypothetical protein
MLAAEPGDCSRPAFDLLLDDDGSRHTTPVKNTKTMNKTMRIMMIFLMRRDESLKKDIEI